MDTWTEEGRFQLSLQPFFDNETHKTILKRLTKISFVTKDQNHAKGKSIYQYDAVVNLLINEVVFQETIN